ncbi:MAG: pyruvate kinase [Sulfolobales archaeon]
MLRAKIIASIGPSSEDPKIIRELYIAGVDCFRINFSHGDLDSWSRYIEAIRAVEKEFNDKICVLGDLRGPSIRLGDLKENMSISKGSKVVFSRDPSKGIPVDSDEFFKIVDEGDMILMDDGKIRFEVIRVAYEEVEAIALTDSILSSRKNIAVRGKSLKSSIFSPRDSKAIEFSVREGITYIGVSHVRDRRDIEIIRKSIRGLGGNQRILAKIENRIAIDNLREIIHSSDGVVIARGDLGMSLGLEEIPRVQEEIVRESRRLGKPVILATQLLESMIKSPIPTRSEVQDIYSGVLYGVDGFMLTGETAVGSYPIEAVKWLRKIIDTSEKYLYESGRSYNEIRYRVEEISDPAEKFFYGVVKLAESLNAYMLLFSSSGSSAIKVSSLRPRVEVICGTNRSDVFTSLKILWGVEPVYVDAKNHEDGLDKTLKIALERELIERGRMIVLAYAIPSEDKYVVSIKRAL